MSKRRLAALGVLAVLAACARPSPREIPATAGTVPSDAGSSRDGDQGASNVVEAGTVPSKPIDGSDGTVSIPAGDFMMGSLEDVGARGEHPQHLVHVGAFAMDRTEVTVSAYEACVNAAACTAADGATPGTEPFCNWGQPDRAEHPINCVDWNQAVAFCRWANKRLPTEEEWEYAARGKDGRTYPWGNEAPAQQCWDHPLPNSCLLCWLRTLQPGTCPVGSFSRGESPFGIRDMAGNVWEWTGSAYSDDYSATHSTALRPGARGPTIRGGGWGSLNATAIRAATRAWFRPDVRADDIGFRCAR